MNKKEKQLSSWTRHKASFKNLLILSYYLLKMWKNSWTLQVPSIAKDIHDLIIVLLAYDKRSQSTSWLTSKTKFAANCKKKSIAKVDEFSGPLTVRPRCILPNIATMWSTFLAYHLIVHTSLTLEIIEILVD